MGMAFFWRMPDHSSQYFRLSHVKFMTTIISFANQKGGVGKSTLCIQAAYYLSKQEKKVLVLDMDAQGNTSSRLAPKADAESSKPVFSGTKTIELFAEALSNITPMPCGPFLDLIHTPVNDPELAEVESSPLEIALLPARHLGDFLQTYDFVLIDCPPSLGRKLVAALALSTHVVCPVKLSGFAVDGVEGLLHTIIGVQENVNPNLKLLGLIINDMDRSTSHERALKELTAAIPDLLFKNKIMHRSPLDTATSEGVPVWDLSYGHVAAKEVKAVLDEILERIEG